MFNDQNKYSYPAPNNQEKDNTNSFQNISLNNTFTANNINNSSLMNITEKPSNNQLYSSSNNSEKFDHINNKFSESNKFFISKINKSSSRIEDIIDKGDYNLKTYKIIFLTCLFVFIEGFYLTYFNSIFNPFQKFYGISDTAVQTVAAVKFLGMAIGSMGVGYFSKCFSRKSIILFSILSILILHFLMCFIKNVIVFGFIRFFMTVFIGFYMVLIINILTEYLPIRLRSFALNVIWIFWCFGAIFFLLLCKIYIPNLDYDPSKPFETQNFYSAIFPLFYVVLATLIIYIFFLEDSPRNLILTGKIAEAKKILEYYTDSQIQDEDMKCIENNLVGSGENKFYENESEGNIIFHKRIRFLTINMMVLFFLISLSFYGISVANPNILKNLQRGADGSSTTNISFISLINDKNKKMSADNASIINSNSDNRMHKANIQVDNKNNAATHFAEIRNVSGTDNTINSLILIYVIGIVGNIAGGIISEISGMGRKYSEILLFALALIIGFLSIIAYNDYSLWMGISTSLFGAAFNIHIVYTEEIYPTKIRDYAVGMLLGMTRLGGFTAQYLFIVFSKASLFFAVYAYLIMVFVKIILLFLLPNDNVNHIDAKIDLDESRMATSSEDEISVLKEEEGENKRFIVKENKNLN